MAAIWQRVPTGWGQLGPTLFNAEAALHDLVEEAPQLLPLSGSPALVVVGREVQLGANYADLIAIEPAGRLVVIEVKLANNAEARRAIVAQILTYAAFLDRMDLETLESRVLRKHLDKRGFDTLATAAASAGADAYNAATFAGTLAENVHEGRFRLVLVLDSAPTELTRLVGFLEARTEGLVIDLVTVSAYLVGGEQILVPQRVQPERNPADVPAAALGEVPSSAGTGEFRSRLAGTTASVVRKGIGWSTGLKASQLRGWRI